MSRVIIIGCGGVAQVAIKKCCQNSDVFTDLCIASRTLSRCEKVKNELEGKTKTNITVRKIDAEYVDDLLFLFNDFKPDLVMNLGMPYQNLIISVYCSFKPNIY